MEETEDEFDLTMHINVKDGWHGSKYAIARMMRQQASAGRPRGRIINIASIRGLVGIAQQPAYCASKGSVVNLTRQLAVGFGRTNRHHAWWFVWQGAFSLEMPGG
nr:SDR family oxidoreductase [Pseudomonas urmiensis]